MGFFWNPRKTDAIARAVFWFLGILTVSIFGIILLRILAGGLLKALDPSFLFGKPEAVRAGGGIFPMIGSTLYITVLTVAISLPFSIGTAIYLSEFTSVEGRLTGAIRLAIDTLASMPSIVFGLFGMSLFVVYLRWGYSLLSGACTLTALNLPVLVRSAEEALRAVPQSYREASLSLGASKWATIRQVVLPTATPGIIAGTVLSLGRIVGESAALVYTAGLFTRKFPLNPLRTGAPLASYIWYVQTEARIPDYRSIVDGGAAVLLLLVLALNFAARALGRYYGKKKLAE